MRRYFLSYLRALHFLFSFFSPTGLYQIGAEGTFDRVQGVFLTILDIRHSTFDIRVARIQILYYGN